MESIIGRAAGRPLAFGGMRLTGKRPDGQKPDRPFLYPNRQIQDTDSHRRTLSFQPSFGRVGLAPQFSLFCHSECTEESIFSSQNLHF